MSDLVDPALKARADVVLAEGLQTKLRAFLLGIGLGVEVGPEKTVKIVAKGMAEETRGNNTGDAVRW